jgi:hypothetical protein
LGSGEQGVRAQALARALPSAARTKLFRQRLLLGGRGRVPAVELVNAPIGGVVPARRRPYGLRTISPMGDDTRPDCARRSTRPNAMGCLETARIATNRGGFSRQRDSSPPRIMAFRPHDTFARRGFWAAGRRADEKGWNTIDSRRPMRPNPAGLTRPD